MKMSEQEEVKTTGLRFPELEGTKIVSVKVDGGYKFGRSVTILLDNGKTFRINARFTLNDSGIYPHLDYEVGGWVSQSPPLDGG